MTQDNLFLSAILIILSVAFLLLAAFSIPFFLQLWRTAKSAALIFETINQSLPVIMNNLEAMTGSMNRTTTTIHRQVEALSLSLGKIQGVLGFIIGVEEVLRRRVPLPLTHLIRTSLAVVKGIRVFLGSLMQEGVAGTNGSARKAK